jgi:quinol monooxygenase YgiN
MSAAVTIKVSITEGRMAEFLAWATDTTGLPITRGSKGCKHVWQSVDEEKHRVIMWEIWESAEDFQAYMGMRQEKYAEQMGSLIVPDSFDVEILALTEN